MLILLLLMNIEFSNIIDLLILNFYSNINSIHKDFIEIEVGKNDRRRN